VQACSTVSYNSLRPSRGLVCFAELTEGTHRARENASAHGTKEPKKARAAQRHSGVIFLLVRACCRCTLSSVRLGFFSVPTPAQRSGTGHSRNRWQVTDQVGGYGGNLAAAVSFFRGGGATHKVYASNWPSWCACGLKKKEGLAARVPYRQGHGWVWPTNTRPGTRGGVAKRACI